LVPLPDEGEVAAEITTSALFSKIETTYAGKVTGLGSFVRLKD
jgi:hypothetical protein